MMTVAAWEPSDGGNDRFGLGGGGLLTEKGNDKFCFGGVWHK